MKRATNPSSPVLSFAARDLHDVAQSGDEGGETLARVEVAVPRPFAAEVGLQVEPGGDLQDEVEPLAVQEPLPAEQHDALQAFVEGQGVAIQLLADLAQARPVQFDEFFFFLSAPRSKTSEAILILFVKSRSRRREPSEAGTARSRAAAALRAPRSRSGPEARSEGACRASPRPIPLPISPSRRGEIRASISLRSGETDIAYIRVVRTISPATMYGGFSLYITEPGCIWTFSAVRERKSPRS